MVKVKICGITNLADALNSIAAGCDGLGFVFYKKSPHYIIPLKAKEMIRKLPKRIKKIGVFVNEKESVIKRTADICGLDMLQFHGDEPPEFCQKFKKYKVIKAFRVKRKIDLKKISKYDVFACLFDTYVPSKIGGTGKSFDWRLLIGIDKIKRPIFLSGGLNVGNIKEAIRRVRPAWVDVSTSVEQKLGKKDSGKVREFIQKAKGRPT